MAKTFGQYTGGIQAIQGINEFGAQQAAGIQRTGDVISGLITQGFKDYNENKNKREVTTAKGAGLYESLKFMQANIRDNPELGQFADRFEPLMKKFSQFESMSTNQQAGFLIEAEAFEKSITPNLALYEKGLVARTKQGVQDALSKEVKIPDNQGGYVKGTPFSTTDTIEQNLALARKSFEVQAKTGGLTNFDINSALEKLTTQWENGFANDPNMAKNDPKLRDAILKNISDYRVQNKLAGDLAGQTSEEYGTGENIISQVMALGEAQQGASTSAAKALENKDIAATLEAQSKVKTPAKADNSKAKEELIAGDINKYLVKESADGKLTLNKNYEKLKTSVPVGDTYRYIENDAKRAGTWNQEEYDKAVAADKILESNVNFYQRKAPNENAYYDSLRKETGVAQRKQAIQDPRVADFAKGDFGENGIPSEALKLAETLGFQRSDYGIGIKGFGEMLPFGTGAVFAPAGYAEATNELPRALQDFFGRVKEGKYDKTTGVVDTGRPADAGKNDFIQPIKTQSVEALKPIWEKAGKTGETKSLVSEAKPEVAPANKYARVFDFGVKIQEGVKEGFRQETFAEEKERVRQWFVTNNKGIIPSALEEVYASIRPETSVRFMPAPDGLGGQVMITPKGAQYIPPVKTTGMSDKEKSEVTLYNWGTKTATGEYIATERTPNSGIKLAGFALGGEKNAEAFQQLHADTVKIRTIVPQLLAMYKTDKLGRTLIPNENWGLAKSLLAQLKAAIRVETVGTGPVAIAEHKSIQDRVSDPTAFLSLDIVGKGTLEGLLKSNEMALINNNAGIQVEFTVPKEARAKSTQQVKLTEKTRVK